MQVTSDYYRNSEHRPELKDGLLECWTRSVQNAKEAFDVEPLRPSRSTLQKLARHYQKSRSIKRSA